MKLFLILLLAASLRLWNLPARMPFLADQGRDMLRVYELYTAHRLTLLGPSSSQGNFFFGPLYYYLIAPGLILAKFHPLGTVLNVILVDLIGLYFLFRLTRSVSLALIYATSPLLIHWSQSALNPFFIPGLTAIFLFCLSRRKFFLAGILAGSIIQLHYAAVILAIFIFRPAFLLGLLIGLSPMLAFELRHSWFNTQGILAFLTTPQFRSFNLHYLAVLVPFLFWAAAKIFNRFRLLTAVITTFIVIMNLRGLDLYPAQGYTMPAHWNLPRAYATAQIIAQDVAAIKPQNFTVAATLDGDSRALPLRYLLVSQFRTIPLGVASYPQAQVLYLVTRLSQAEALSHGLWEISSFSPKRVTGSWPLVADINLYRLEKL